MSRSRTLYLDPILDINHLQTEGDITTPDFDFHNIVFHLFKTYQTAHNLCIIGCDNNIIDRNNSLSTHMLFDFGAAQKYDETLKFNS